MSGVLMTHSYFLALDPKMRRLMTPYPPLGSLIAAACLRRDGHDVRFFDATFARGPQEIPDAWRNRKPDVFVIYDDDFNYLTKMCLSNMRHAAFEMIRRASTENIPVVVHGSDATDHAADYHRHGARAVIVGEGEATLGEVINTLARDPYADLSEIRGLKLHDRSTPPREFIDDLDRLPDPDFGLVDIDRYRHAWRKKHGYFSLNVSTTRGCPFHCNWCAKPIYGQIYHSYSPAKVARHWREVNDRFEPDRLWITDDIFGLKPGWLDQFEQECGAHNVRIPYKCQTRADLLLRDGMIDRLKATGCADVWIGAESGSQKVLDAMEKGIQVGQIYEATRRVKQAGMKVSLFIQFGYTGETWDDIVETRRLLRQTVPSEIGISVSYPLPGTKFYNRVREQLKAKQNWTDSDDLDMMFVGTYPRPFYKLLQRFAHSEYRARKIVQERQWKKLVHLIYHTLRLFYYRLAMNSHMQTR